MSKIIDVHTHILPSLDDGSRSVEMSLEMLRNESDQGIETVVFTPHFYANHDSPKRFLDSRAAAVDKLMSAVAGQMGLPNAILGAEVHYFEGISDCEFLKDMAFELADGEKRYIMIEMPMKRWNDRMLFEIESIRQKQKLVPIIAHIDRYICSLGIKKIPDALFRLPVVIQANSSFFTKRSTRRTALNMLRDGYIHLIGSDCHNLDDRRSDIGAALDAIEKHLGQAAIDHIVSCQNGKTIR